MIFNINLLLCICLLLSNKLLAQQPKNLSLKFETVVSNRVYGLSYIDSVGKDEVIINMHKRKNDVVIVLKVDTLKETDSDNALLTEVKLLYDFIISAGDKYPGFHPHPGDKSRFRFFEYYLWYKRPTDNVPWLLTNTIPKGAFRTSEEYNYAKSTLKRIKKIRRMIKKL